MLSPILGSPFQQHLEMGPRLLRVLTALVSLAWALGLALWLQPEQGSRQGRFGVMPCFFVDLGEGRCLHVHHFLLCAYTIGVIFFAVVACGGTWTLPLVCLVSCIVGLGLSDAVYTDLSLQRSCILSLPTEGTATGKDTDRLPLRPLRMQFAKWLTQF